MEKENTVLPDESKKDDLFAAIEVNKLFSLFNISKMQTSDLPNVERALEAYQALTDEQKDAIEFIKGLSDDELKWFIAGAKAMLKGKNENV